MSKKTFPELVIAKNKEIERLTAEGAVKDQIIAEFTELIGESHGVDGLHLNGDIADWNWLMNNQWLEKYMDWATASGRRNPIMHDADCCCDECTADSSPTSEKKRCSYCDHYAVTGSWECEICRRTGKDLPVIADSSQDSCCWNCATQIRRATRMIVCPNCGNKRCPRATDHNLDCTNSNDPDQPGSRYATADSKQAQSFHKGPDYDV